MDENDEDSPALYERRKLQTDEFLRWCGRATIFMLLVLNVLMIGFWWKLDKIYNGNPQSGGRELVCAIAIDDARADTQVKVVYDRVCTEFPELNSP